MGPRGCIGERMARFEMRTFVSRMLERFEVGLHDPARIPVPETMLSLRPDRPILLSLANVP